MTSIIITLSKVAQIYRLCPNSLYYRVPEDNFNRMKDRYLTY